MNKLVLRYKFDADDFGRLSLEVVTEHFSGKGSFWVQWQDVIEFAEQLAVDPIEVENPIVAQWGYDMQEGNDLILRISIAPKNPIGDLTVSVEVADDDEPARRLNTSFRSGYAALDLFRRDIVRLMEKKTDEAVLFGY